MHTYPVWTDLHVGPGSPGQWWARHKITGCTRAGEKTEKNRQDTKGMVQNMTLRKGQWLSEDSGRLQQRNTAPLTATFTKQHSRCSHSTGAAVCKLETAVKPLSTSSAKYGPSANAHPVGESKHTLSLHVQGWDFLCLTLIRSPQGWHFQAFKGLEVYLNVSQLTCIPQTSKARLGRSPGASHKKLTPLWQLLSALSLSGVGETKALPEARGASTAPAHPTNPDMGRGDASTGAGRR